MTSMATTHAEPTNNIDVLGVTLLDTTLPLSRRFRALFTLKGLGGPEAVKAIARGFDDSSELLKHELAYCLGQMGDESAIAVLIGVLKNTKQEPVVRHEAAEAIAALHNTEYLSLLEEYKNDPVPEVSETCDIGAGLLRWLKDEENKTEQLSESRFESVDPAPPLKKEEVDVEKISNMLLDTSISLFVRYRALFTLRNLGSEDAVLAICEGFKDGSALFRHECAFVLGQLQSGVSVPTLIEVLKNEKEAPMVRHEAAEALGSIASEEHIQVLLKEYAQEHHPRIIKESCDIALDMYDHEQAGDFQYADGGVDRS